MTTTSRATAGQLERRARFGEAAGAQLVRAAGDDAAEPRFTGHAAVFESRTAIGNPLGWGFFEEIARGAFEETLDGGDARFLIDHSSSLLVARVSAEDLRLSTDSVGLAVDADLDTEVSYVRDLVRNLEKRRITGMSFGFQVRDDTWSEVEVDVVGTDGKTAKGRALLRVINVVDLLEVSAVTFPAYEDTDAGVRSRVEEARSALGAAPQVPTQRRSPDHITQRARALAALYGRP